MADDRTSTDVPTSNKADMDARRRFLKAAGQVAVTTPAVILLLSAGAKKSQAGIYALKRIDEGGDVCTEPADAQSSQDHICQI